MNLPPLLVLTDRRAAASRGRTLAATVALAVEGGATALVLREKDLPLAERTRLGEQVHAVLPTGCLFIVASDVELAQQLGADGVHLAARDTPARSSLPPELLVGRSCHDATDIRDAITDAVDYVTVSPVYATVSKPGYGPPLGPDGLGALTSIAGGTRVYALGGVDAAAVTECLATGVSGVAVMGAVMRTDDPATAVTRILAALRQPITAPGAPA